MGRKVSDKRMEAVDVQSARLQGEVSTVIHGSIREERQLVDAMGRLFRDWAGQGVRLLLCLVPCASLSCEMGKIVELPSSGEEMIAKRRGKAWKSTLK